MWEYYVDAGQCGKTIILLSLAKKLSVVAKSVTSILFFFVSETVSVVEVEISTF